MCRAKARLLVCTVFHFIAPPGTFRDTVDFHHGTEPKAFFIEVAMARIRTIKPEFWTSEQVVECSPIARLLFVGMWNFCDDGGNHPASAKTLKMQIFPGDDIAASQIESYISELLSSGLLSEYTAEGRKYWHVTGWKHQKIDRPSYKHPRPFVECSSNDGRGLDDGHPPEGKGREGKGMESNLPPNPQGGEAEEENTHLFSDPDTRRFFAMPMDWNPDPVELQKYVNGKIHSGKPLTLETVLGHLGDYREATHAKGEKRTESEWCRALVKWAQRCLSNPVKPASKPPTEQAPLDLYKPIITPPPFSNMRGARDPELAARAKRDRVELFHGKQ